MFKIKIYFYNDDTSQSETFETIANSIDEAIEKSEEVKPYLFDVDWNYIVEEITIVVVGETAMVTGSLSIYQSKINERCSVYKDYFEKENSEMMDWIMAMDIKRLMSSVFKMVKGCWIKSPRKFKKWGIKVESWEI